LVGEQECRQMRIEYYLYGLPRSPSKVIDDRDVITADHDH